MFDTGNTGFMLVATSLVMLMTPGLAFFYGGLVGRKNVLTIMIQSFVSMGVTTILWWAYGYSLCFSGGEGGIIGNLDKAFLAGSRSRRCRRSVPGISRNSFSWPIR
jgi:Amt family ammonium transporter